MNQMKRCYTYLTVFACIAAFAAGCSKQDVVPAEVPAVEQSTRQDNGLVSLTFNVSDGLVRTKTNTAYSNESTISSLYIGVFDQDGKNVARNYHDFSTGDERVLSVSVPRGIYTIYVAANARVVLSSMYTSGADSTEVVFNSQKLTLNYEFVAGGFAYTKKLEKYIVDRDATVNLNLSRVESKITLTSIINDGSYPVTINNIFLINIPDQQPLWNELDMSSVTWINKRNLTMSMYEPAYGYVWSQYNETIDSASASSTSSIYYTLPNYTAEDSHDETWSPRHTRLAINATCNGITGYYAVTLPVIARNQSIELSLVINNPSHLLSNPDDDPGSSIWGSYTINIQDWDGVTNLGNKTL